MRLLPRHRTLLFASLGWSACSLATSPGGAHAQAPAGSRPQDAGVTWTMDPRPQLPLAAAALRLAAGSATDPEGREGTAWITGHALAEGVNRALRGTSASASVQVSRGWTLFTLLAPPEEWRGSMGAVLEAVLRSQPEARDVETARERLLDHLRFESGSPARLFRLEAVRLLSSPDDPWTRPVDGSIASVRSVTVDDVRAYHRRAYRADSATLAVLGPVSEATTREVLGPSAARPHRGTSTGADLPAWLTGDRFSLTREVTSTWIAIDYPARPSTPRTTLEFLAYLVQEALDPYPPAEDVYDVSVRLEDAPRGPVVRVEASVFPESSGRWQSRILKAVGDLADDPMTPDFFQWRRRRFRAVRLLAEAEPEREAARMTLDLLRQGVARDLNREIWGLRPAEVAAAARGLGEPRILVMGPDLGQADRPGARGAATEPGSR